MTNSPKPEPAKGGVALAEPPADAPPEKGVSTWSIAWRQFKRDNIAKVALAGLILLGATAFFSPLLANNKPLVCSYKGTLYFPAFKDYLDENVPIPWDIPARLQRTFPSLSPAYKGSPLPRRPGESFPDWRSLKAELDASSADGWYIGAPLPYYYKEISTAIKVRPFGPVGHLTVLDGKAKGEVLEFIPRHVWAEASQRLRARDPELGLQGLVVEWAPIGAPPPSKLVAPSAGEPDGPVDPEKVRAHEAALAEEARAWTEKHSRWTVRAAEPEPDASVVSAPVLLGDTPLDAARRALDRGDVIKVGQTRLRFTTPRAHPMGTDADGRDVLSRLIHGCVIAVSVGFVSVGIYVTIGIILGALAGYFRGTTDLVISRLIEIVICFPTFFLIITIVAVLQKASIYNVMIALGLTGWTGVARLVRGEFLKCMAEDYVAAAKALGLSDLRIIFRHVLPNAMAPVFVSASFGVAGAILTESSLSFLGFGVAPPTASWGEILQQGRNHINENCYHLVWFPGLAIFFTVTMFNLVGEGLRDALDPKLRQ